jgi:hypothetical protein
VQRSAGRTNKSPCEGREREILRPPRHRPLRQAQGQDFACGLPLGFASLTPAIRLKFKSARPDQFFVHKYALLTGRISSCRPTKYPKGIVQELDFIGICGPLLGGLGYVSCAGQPRRAAHLEPS